MTRLAVSIVVFKSDLALLARVIGSVDAARTKAAEEAPLTCSVDIVDNDPSREHDMALAAIAEAATTDGMSVTLIRTSSNGGYGAGNNISIRCQPSVDYHLVLNPDVLLSDDALAAALKYMEAHPDVGLLTPQVHGFDGSLHHLCKLHPTLFDMFLRSVSSAALNRMFAERRRRFEMRDRDYRHPIERVPYPTGCFMFFRRSVLARIGGFDEGYFLHYEDADMGRQVERISQTTYVPDVVVLHKWSRGSHEHWRMRWITIKSGLRYWWKWGGVF